MFQIRLTQASLWVDSKNGVHSPYEQFQLLSDEARSSLESDLTPSHLAWEFGVLSDEWPAPEYTKSHVAEDGDSETDAADTRLHPVGYEAAAHVSQELRPLFIDVISWLAEECQPQIYILADQLWHPDGRWMDIAAGAAHGLLAGANLDLHPTARSGRYTAQLSSDQLRELLTVWWPSGLGMFGAVCGTDRLDRVRTSLTESGMLMASDLRHVRRVFETSRSFDNLGLALLSSGVTWEDIRRACNSHQWSDGAVVG